MSFTSLYYFPFLFIVVIAYNYMGRRKKLGFLLAVSWFVYGLFGLSHFIILLFVTATGYFCGKNIKKNQKRKKIILAIGIFIIVGMLICTKYINMFFSWSEALLVGLGQKITLGECNIILPVGISFYTFQSLSYMIDAYRGKEIENSFVKYALYISFFPQLVAGPVEQSGKLIPQFCSQRISRQDVGVGICYLLSGSIRKFVIADYMAIFVDEVYGNVTEQSGINLLTATVLFSVQIYCDFSGYTHIALGSARFFGIQLTENFDRPYLAVGCREFWKCWHITLTKWFTEYVYIPLGGSRKGNRRKYFNIMIVFLLSGLWHGADLTFICWGGFFGIWRILEEISVKVKQTEKITQGHKLVKRFATFSLVCLSWVLFRSKNMEEAMEVFRRIFTMNQSCPFILGKMEAAGIAVRIGILAVIPRIILDKEFRVDMNNGEIKSSYVAVILLFLIVISMLFIFDKGSGSGFIYFQF